jgi:hypothetical protein
MGTSRKIVSDAKTESVLGRTHLVLAVITTTIVAVDYTAWMVPARLRNRTLVSATGTTIVKVENTVQLENVLRLACANAGTIATTPPMILTTS